MTSPRVGFIAIAVLASLLAALRADYELPRVERTVAVLIEAGKVRIDPGARALLLGEGNRSFPIDVLFLQDRIASAGIDTGDFSASHARMRQMAQSTGQGRAGWILAEFVQVSGKWVVSYLNDFDAARDFQRYFAAPVRGDRIELRLNPPPRDAVEFDRQMRERSAAEFQAILKK